MNEYPEKTCNLDSLVRNPKMVAASIAGQKTQQRRNGVYGYPGEKFELDGTSFLVTALEQKSLGDMTEEDAKSEGFPNLSAYKDIIIRMHPGMEWDPKALVWVHHYQKAT
jgi:hypothetical protein